MFEAQVDSWDWGWTGVLDFPCSITDGDDEDVAPAPTRRRIQQRKEKASRRERVDETWFDGEVPQKLVRLLSLRMDSILSPGKGKGKKAKADSIVKAQAYLAWFLGEAHDEYGLSFQVCASGLGGDPEMIRTRLQVELAKRWIVTAGPVTARPAISADLLDQVRQIGGAAGVALFRAAWSWPGIPVRQLFAEIAGKVVSAGGNAEMVTIALNRLTERGYITIVGGEHCYATGELGIVYFSVDLWQ